MPRPESDDGAIYKPKRPDQAPGFESVFPTESAGDGKLRSNNRHTGAAQGRASDKRKVSCAVCGFMVDLSKTDLSGGDENGNGAGGAVTTTTNEITPTGGGTYTEYSPDQALRKGAGCPLCFSKNGSREKSLDSIISEPLPNLGY